MTDEVPVARVGSLSELTEIVPYLVGFDPQESLVAMVVDGGRVALTARTDLSDPARPDSVEYLMNGIQARYPTAQVFALAYTDDPDRGWQALQRSEQVLGGRIAGSILVNGDTWYSDGQTGAVRRDGPMAAQATVYGLRRASSRSELGSALDSPAGTEAHWEALSRAEERLPERGNVAGVAMMAELTARHLKGSVTLGSDEAAQLAVLVNQRPDARDAALLAITTNAADRHLRLWSGVVQQVPEEVATPPLILAGMAAWVSGDGATASMAMERLDARGASSYGAAPLLDTILTNMLNPQQWDQLRGRLLLEVVRSQASAPGTGGHEPVWESVRPSNPSRRPEPPSAAEPPRPGPAI